MCWCVCLHMFVRGGASDYACVRNCVNVDGGVGLYEAGILTANEQHIHVHICNA